MRRDDWEAAASDWLAGLSAKSLRRNRRVVRAIDATHVEIDGQKLVNFSSNDYLGLSHHASVIDACCEAVRTYGSGAGAAPLVTGQTPLHAVQSFLALNQEFSRQFVHRYVIGRGRENLSGLAVLHHSR